MTLEVKTHIVYTRGAMRVNIIFGKYNVFGQLFALTHNWMGRDKKSLIFR